MGTDVELEESRRRRLTNVVLSSFPLSKDFQFKRLADIRRIISWPSISTPSSQVLVCYFINDVELEFDALRLVHFIEHHRSSRQRIRIKRVCR